MVRSFVRFLRSFLRSVHIQRKARMVLDGQIRDAIGNIGQDVSIAWRYRYFDE